MDSVLLLNEERKIFIHRMRIASFYFATPLVVSFSFVDHFFLPDKFFEFLCVRLVVIPISIAVYLSYKNDKIREKHWEVPALLLIFYLGIYHAYLVSQSGYEQSGYYAGINIAAVGALSFLPWQPMTLPIASLLTFAPYFMVLAIKGSSLDLRYLIPNSAFIFSTVFVAVTSFFITRHLRKKEVNAKASLERQNQEQAELIKRKTKEGVYLERLAGQFSPQIVSAIKAGELDIDKKSRREITCVFLDIENSTRRSARIDYALYNELIGEFFSECIEIFLKHDVTIGTYLGDGILAFANAPGNIPNHRKQVVDACLEILKSHHQKQNYYKEKWRTDFNIRVGIETGYTTVGFFPSRTKGTYTALGETVNLASRLCSRAKPNSICVAKQFLRDLGPYPDFFKAQKQDQVSDIKGFEDEIFELYSLTPSLSENSQKSIANCVLCSAPMKIDADFGDSLYLSCTRCSYKDIQDSPKAALGAQKAHAA